jgi:SAM-dependent MidA family methyltransferase
MLYQAARHDVWQPSLMAGGPAGERWREAMHRALYEPGGGFFVRDQPAEHFRTSVHASPLFAAALARLLDRVDAALGHPDPIDVVDIGAGRGELLVALAYAAAPAVHARLRLTAVELADRPAHLPPDIAWRDTPPEAVTGLLLATEWLDNVPLDLAVRDGDGTVRYQLTDGSPGGPVSAEDAAWLSTWWPLTDGGVAEIGLPRDRAWRTAVGTLRRGLALCVDYGHLRESRPPLGTLTGYRGGRQVPPVPDGHCDLTAHVAMDSLGGATLVRQRDALRALGVSGARPPLSMASTDPAGYVRALAAAGEAAELTDPAGLGEHFWLLEPVGIGSPL